MLEVAGDSCSPRFGIGSIERVKAFIPDFVRYHKVGDISLIIPWLILNEDQEITCTFDQESLVHVFPKGKLLLPLGENEDESITVFMPCGGFDVNDELPAWVRSVPIDQITKVAS